MAEKTLNTRLVLRNAELSAWEQSTVKLLQGEMALAQLSGDQAGCYKVRIGTGDKTWNELSDQGQLIIPVENVEGLTAAIQQLSTSYYETDDIAKLSSTYVNGDIAVEKKDIADGKQEYCAYRYNTQISSWQALDGNYSAENVYFKNDFTLAGDYTQVGNVKLASGTLAASGKSVKALFEDIFDKTIQPTHRSYASATVTLTNATNDTNRWKEIGTTFVPAYTTNFSQGTYNTPWNSSYVTDGTSAKSWSITDGTTTKTAAADSFDSFTVLSSTSYKINGSMEYNAGTIAKDNKGNDSNPVLQHLSGTYTIGNSKTVQGYYPCYWGFATTTAAKLSEHPTSTEVKTRLTNKITGTTRYVQPGTSCKSTNSWYQLAYAVPHVNGKTITEAKDSNNLNVDFTKVDSAVAIDFGTEAGTLVYDLFLCNMLEAYDPTTVTITWA